MCVPVRSCVVAVVVIVPVHGFMLCYTAVLHKQLAHNCQIRNLLCSSDLDGDAALCIAMR